MNEKPLRANAEQEEMKKELKRSIDYRLNDLKEKYTSQLDGATEDDLQREKRLFKRQKEATEEDLYKLISSYSPTKEEVMPIVEAFRKLLDEIKAVGEYAGDYGFLPPKPVSIH
jgi:spermidine/putrescine-binding protein